MPRPLPTQKQKKLGLGYFAQLPPGPTFFTPHSSIWTDLPTPKEWVIELMHLENRRQICEPFETGTREVI